MSAGAGGGRASGARVNAGAGRVHAGGGGGGIRAGGGGHHAMRAGGGSFRAGGGGGGRGGGRRSDIRLKHDIALLGFLDHGLGFYRFSYNGSDKAYVGVMAQEVQQIMPAAVAPGSDGYLRVYYEKLGLRLESYDHWIRSGARVPVIAPVRLPDHLALAGRAVSAGLFEGLHLDVEPHALAAWRDPSSRLPLFEHAPALCHGGAQAYLAGSLRSPLPWKLAT